MRLEVKSPVFPAHGINCPDWLEAGMKRAETREAELLSRMMQVEKESDRDQGAEKEQAGLREERAVQETR
ncbi:hypothetical protein NDU88_006406 [Pleurodeles waltl]|uniref:Uncharacterized protein n=1 Tax=Pleurodeles waltl TaxID=8319 RepID=A0AAV7QP06_PLEWA|nr:hypothetical protein NDU88_006406 [Pleurodeles waltl]